MVPWQLISEGALRMRVVAVLMCGLLSWSRSRHTSGKLTMAAAITVILVNSIPNLPYA